MGRFILCFLALALASAGPAGAASRPLRVVTSFSILADMAHNVGGNDIDVTSLVGRDADAHVYQPTPEDAKTLANADLIFVNGLGFDGWMTRLIAASGTKARTVTVTNGLKGRLLVNLKGEVDPHAWQNATNGRLYVRTIAAALEQALPADAQKIAPRAAAYDASLDQMDRFIHLQFAGIPEKQRVIILSHDSFGYFGAAYGITFLAPEGLSTESEPTAMDVAKLLRQIKSAGIHTLFIENMSNPKLIEQIARDAGADIGGTLYSDALSPSPGPAPTYLAMFRNNVSLLKAAMLENRP
jgi:zinc/manganese transport system substrate-binding protein